MTRYSAPAANTVVAAVCRSCERELRINHQDDPEAAFKRNRWSNKRPGKPHNTGICRPYNKKGRF